MFRTLFSTRLPLLIMLMSGALLLGARPARAQNAIQVENALAGNPASQWDISGVGDASIQGFATDISVNRGGTIHFKIKTDANPYHIEIYRLGYYNGDGARLQGAGVVTATLPQSQPDPLTDGPTGLVDCGNWAESAHWVVPANAVSGIYIARLVRDDNQGASHIAFIVRDDASTSDVLFKTADCTWQAYNVYGGNSLYVGSAPRSNGNAAKVSFNRPFSTRGGGGGSGSSEDWLFNAEYPMVRFLEANGYDVSYTTDLDTDRDPTRLLQHHVFLTAGHDEYWSAGERAAVEAARDAGVHLAMFDGNEVYWKTRWEPSIDGTNTDHRTLVCYKEGTLGENVCGGRCDPLPGTWTGLWRDGCAFPTLDGCNPENSLSGQISWDGNTGAIQVPDTYKNLRLWRNTSVAALGAGQTATLGSNTLGYEWDWEQYPASYPPGRILLSSTVLNNKTHHLSLYRHASGALVFGAGTVQWSWGLDSRHDRSSDAPVPAMQQATVNLLADMGVQPATLQAGLAAASASTDTQAPSSAITSPLAGASLQSGVSVTITGTATEAGGGVLVGVEVSTDGGVTWQRATGTTSWTLAWSPSTQGAVTIKSRGFDDSGNLEGTTSEGQPNIVTVTVAPAVCPCSVFQPTDTPGGEFNDGHAINVGMKFRTTVDGFVTGARFYKGPANLGTHTGLLWASTGALLAQADFTGESASGWQEVSFSPPVAVTAGSTYIVAYLSSGGGYAADDVYFSSAVANGPLRALASGEDGPNGVYAAAGTPTFPTSNFLTSNYWVDVVFNTSVGPDVTPPTVTATSPSNGATAVSVNTAVTATFSEAINPATVSGATLQLTGPGAVAVAGTVSYSAATRSAQFVPAAALAYSTSYTATVTGGAGGIADPSNNVLAANVTWTFTTSAPPPPPPTEGPGGPILVISSAANPFSRYPVEILRAEGLNAFTAMDLSLVTPTVLSAYDVVVLGQSALSAADVSMLSDWTTAGGTLIAFRPDAQLAPLLGLTPVAGTLSNGYLLVNTASGPGAGIVSQTMQFHGDADLYTLGDATAVATLYSNATTALPNPAVTLRSVGANGGRAMAFTYDLARSIVYTRQGNPAWAGTKRDGQIEPIRSDDMYFGNAAGDPQPDWVDFSKIAIPQADEQQRLLANAIIQGDLHRKPLPRFWYLPKGLKAAIVMTGDNHGDSGMAPRFEIYRNQSPANCSVDDWECVRATGYLYLGTAFTSAQATLYKSLGFEVSLHVNTNCARYTRSEYEDFLTTQMSAFAAKYPDIPLVTNRNHCISFPDWSTTPELEVEHGIRFDTNYYYWPAAWIQDRPGMFTGSGMPMRFAKLDGTLIDCYQAATEMPDESGESFPAFCNTLLDRATGPEGYYGVFTTNMHFDSSPHPGSDAVVASAQAHGVPVVSSQQMLTWIDGRNGSSFAGLTWSGNELSFSIAAATGSRNLQAMVPLMSAVGPLSQIRLDGTPVAFTTQTIKGMQYAFIPAAAGNYVADYAPDTTPPAISGVAAAPHDDGTTTITWTTDEAADSRVDYGTSQGSLGTVASEATPVTSHVVTLSGLAASTVYYYRVTSKDAANNSATQPIVGNDPLSFTTPASVCFRDQVTADFAAGTPGTGTSVVTIGDGDVTLRAAASAEFAVLPPTGEWQGFPWSAGGTFTAGGGLLTVDGARLTTQPTTTTYGPGSSVEFVATFTANRHQYVGFASGDDSPGGMFNVPPWAMFGTGATGASVLARVNVTGALLDFTVPGSLLGTAHKYRVDWKSTSVDFYVDDVLVHTETASVPGPMRAGISELDPGGLALTVDWIHVSPYTASGSFTSRVFDGGGSTTWGQMSWTASLPSGTSLNMFERQGNTLTPDASWTAYASIPTSGTSLTGSSRYVQYRADLATTASSSTPVLRDVHVTCNSSPDVTPPVISNLTPSPGGGGTSEGIGWSTDELSTSRVDYGTAPGALSSNAVDATLVGVHALTLTGLTPGTTYYYRVTSVDGAGNSATEPVIGNPPASFATQAPPCAVDVTTANFTGGTTANTYVSETTDGEVILQPAAGAEFSGALLPAGWTSAAWNAGGSASVGGGQLTLDGAHASPVGSFGPGGSLEFVATFTSATFQNVGFAADAAFGSPWVTIGEGNSTGGVYARRDDGADVLLSATALGAPHRYRIDWTATTFVFYVDGVQVTTMTRTVGSAMVPIASDFNVGGLALSVDWLRLTPYAASGSFTSRVFDSGGTTTWGAATWTSNLPAGTSLALSARRGATPAPDGSWTSFIALPSSGSSVAGTGRYLQYRAALATTDVSVTPELRDVSIECVSTADVTPPVISSIVASPAGDGLSASVTWTSDEPATSRVDFGTSPLALTSNASDASLVTSHTLTLSGLATATTYYYRVTSADGNGNSATSPTPPASASFFTPAPCPSDQTAASFGLGTLDANTAVSLVGDGEIMLKPASATEFSGTSLPGDWQSGTWAAGGAAAVGGGALTVDGAHASTTAAFGPGRSLEFVATYSAATFQNLGFAADAAFNSPWVVIGEGSATDGVYARTSGGALVLLSNAVLGSSHRYRIDWNATNFVFWVDGVQKATVPLTVASNMVAMVSDNGVGGGTLAADWLRVTPYAAAGSFTSRTFDQGGPTNWGVATWTANTPAGTSLSLLARTGNTGTPDGTWSPFLPLTNGVALGGNSRYLQYRADLATSLPGWTPELQGFAIDCVAGPDVTAPSISAVAAVPALDGLSAVVTWSTDEVSSSRVDFGTNAGALSSNTSNASPVRSHSLTLTGLSPLVTYYYRVSSADAASNSSTSPTPPAVLSFTTPALACFVDQTEADFNLGTRTNTYVSVTGDGEVIGAPTLGSEFSATALPSDFTSVLWSSGAAGGSSFPGGSVSVDGGRLAPTSTTGFGPGRVLEFVATFANVASQHIGFASGDNGITTSGMFASSSASWAMFSTSGGGSLKTRVNIAGTATETDLAAVYLGAPHLYRIEWKAAPDSVIFLVDGTSVRRSSATIAAVMRPGASDFTAGGAVLSINWLRMSPYAASGSFVSRVYDGTGPTSWGAMTWTATVPAGTSLALSVRKGNTPVPDGTWTAFAPVASSGSSVGGIARYIQYSAQFTSSADLTPALKDVSITCTPCTGAAPAAIADLAALRQSSGGSAGRLPIMLTFTADPAATAFEVYRAPFGGYPRYDEAGGTLPATPSYPPPAPWAITAVTASGQSDLPATRDQWHYVVFSRNACGTVSAVSNRPGGVLDYKLGDVTDGTAVCAGDNVVSTNDISLLGAHYGETITGSEAYACLDVGPTSDGYVTGRPLTDRQLEFEDLVMFALEYTTTGGGALTASAHAAQPSLAAADGLRLEAPVHVRAGQAFEVAVHMDGAGRLQGVSLQLDWDAAIARPEGMSSGGWLEGQSGVVYSARPGRADAALLGKRSTGIAGSGTLAVFKFRALADGEPAVSLAAVQARDGTNRPVTLEGTAAAPQRPTVTAFDRVVPNPFADRASVRFSLAQEGPVDVSIYSVDGRRVRTLVRGTLPAGTHTFEWDRGNDQGTRVGPGLYFVRLTTVQGRFTHKLSIVQ